MGAEHLRRHLLLVTVVLFGIGAADAATSADSTSAPKAEAEAAPTRYTVLAADPVAGLVSIRSDNGTIEVLERGKESRSGRLLLRSVESRTVALEFYDGKSAERTLWRVDVGASFTPRFDPPSDLPSVRVFPLKSTGDSAPDRKRSPEVKPAQDQRR